MSSPAAVGVETPARRILYSGSFVTVLKPFGKQGVAIQRPAQSSRHGAVLPRRHAQLSNDDVRRPLRGCTSRAPGRSRSAPRQAGSGAMFSFLGGAIPMRLL